jgi:centractin
MRVLAGALEGEVFIGQRAATELRGLLKIRYPLEHGIVTDWDDMEKIWEYVYSEGLKTMSEEVGWYSLPQQTESLLTLLLAPCSSN